MTYNTLLNELIDQSGKMIKEIASECTEKYGVNLTNLYLSNLKTNPGRIASDEISRAIAKACGAEYEDILVVQAYIDKAPQIIKDYLQYIQDAQNMTGDILELFEPQTENQAFQGVMQLLDKFKKPVDLFILIISCLDDRTVFLHKTEVDKKAYRFSFFQDTPLGTVMGQG